MKGVRDRKLLEVYPPLLIQAEVDRTSFGWYSPDGHCRIITRRMTMAESLKLNENQKNYLRIQTVLAVVGRARDLELARIGLNVPQSQVLYCLNEAKVRKEPMTPMQLSRVLHKQPHTVSALVHRMEAQGLVSTKKDMKRKNWLRVSLTKKGDEAVKLWANATGVTDVMSCLSKRE